MRTAEVKSVLLASGGLDSTTLAYWLIDKAIPFYPVFIDYGQHCAKTELETLRDVLPASYAKQVEVINVSDVYKGSHSRLIDEPNLWEDPVTYKDFTTRHQKLVSTKSC